MMTECMEKDTVDTVEAAKKPYPKPKPKPTYPKPEPRNPRNFTAQDILRMNSMPDVMVSYAGRTFTAHVSRDKGQDHLLILCFYENTQKIWLTFQVGIQVVLEVLNRTGPCAVEIEKHCTPYDPTWAEVE